MSTYGRNSRFGSTNKYGSNSNLSIKMSSSTYLPSTPSRSIRTSRSSSYDPYADNRNDRASSVTSSHSSSFYKNPYTSSSYNSSTTSKYTPSYTSTPLSSSSRYASGSVERVSNIPTYTQTQKRFSTNDNNSQMSTSYSFGERNKYSKPPSGRTTNYTPSTYTSSKSNTNYQPVKSSSYADLKNKLKSYTQSPSSGYSSYQTTRSRTPSISSYRDRSKERNHDYNSMPCFNNKDYNNDKKNDKVNEEYEKVCKRYSNNEEEINNNKIVQLPSLPTSPSYNLEIVGKIINNMETEMNYNNKIKKDNDMEILEPKIEPKKLSNPSSAIERMLLKNVIEECLEKKSNNIKNNKNEKISLIPVNRKSNISTNNSEKINDKNMLINNMKCEEKRDGNNKNQKICCKEEKDKNILIENNKLVNEDILNNQFINSDNKNIISKKMDSNCDASISTTIILPDIISNNSYNKRLLRQDRINEHLSLDKDGDDVGRKNINPPILLVTQPSLPSTPHSPNCSVNWSSCFETKIIPNRYEMENDEDNDEEYSDEFYSDEEITDESYDDEECSDSDQEYSIDLSETFTFALVSGTNDNKNITPKGDLYPTDGSSLHVRSTTPLSLTSYDSEFEFNLIEPSTSRNDSRGRVMRESMAKPPPIFTASVHYDGMPEWEGASDDSIDNTELVVSSLSIVRPNSSGNGVYLSADDYSTDDSYDGERFHDTVDVGCTLTLCDKIANKESDDDSDSYYDDDDEDEEYSYEDEEEYSYEEEYCEEYDPDASPYITDEEEIKEDEDDPVERLSVSPLPRFASPKPASDVDCESADELSSTFELPSHQLSQFIVENPGPIATAALQLEPTFTIPVDDKIDVHDHLPEMNAEYEEESSSFVLEDNFLIDNPELKVEPTFAKPISDNNNVFYDRVAPMRIDKAKTDFARKAIIQPNKLEKVVIKDEKIEMKEDIKIVKEEIKKEKKEEVKDEKKVTEQKTKIQDKSDIRKSCLNMNEIERKLAEEKKIENERKRTRGLGTVSTMMEKFKQTETEPITYKRSSLLIKRDEPRVKKPLPALIKPVMNDNFDKQLEELKEQMKSGKTKMESQFINTSKGLFNTSEDAKKKLEGEKIMNKDTERLLKAGEDCKKWKELRDAEAKKRLDEEEENKKRHKTKIQELQETKKKMEEEALKSLKAVEPKRTVRKIIKKPQEVTEEEIKSVKSIETKSNISIKKNDSTTVISPIKKTEVIGSKPTMKVEPTPTKTVNVDALDELMTSLAPPPVKKLLQTNQTQVKAPIKGKTQPLQQTKIEKIINEPEIIKEEPKPLFPSLSKVQNKIARAQENKKLPPNDINNPRNRYGQRRRTQELINIKEEPKEKKIRIHQCHRKNRFIKKPFDIDILLGWDKENTNFEKMESMFERENKNKINWNDDNYKKKRVPLLKVWISQLKDIDKLYKGSELRDIERTVNEY
uniref:SANT domain-containing protein n=2 Tax=Parastrongyloides trichosuri TaxID=131310 RepID=A0A0N5A5E1_PARTI